MNHIVSQALLSSQLICQSSVSLFFFQGSAALWLLFGWAVQCSSQAAFRKSSAAFSLLFCMGQQAFRGQVGMRHLLLWATDTLSIGFFREQGLCISGPTCEIVTMGQAGSTVILAAQLSLCEFCATRIIRFFVSDLFQKWLSWKGAAVAGPFCLKKRRRGKVLYIDRN